MVEVKVEVEEGHNFSDHVSKETNVSFKTLTFQVQVSKPISPLKGIFVTFFKNTLQAGGGSM